VVLCLSREVPLQGGLKLVRERGRVGDPVAVGCGAAKDQNVLATGGEFSRAPLRLEAAALRVSAGPPGSLGDAYESPRAPGPGQ